MLGHSAGGVTSVVYCLEHLDKLSGLVCASFAYKVPAPDFAIAALAGLSHLAPHAHVLALPNKNFSRDAAAVESCFVELAATRGASPHTLRAYRSDLDQFCAFLDERGCSGRPRKRRAAMAAKPALIKNPTPHIDKLAMISNQARSIAEQIKELASNIETAAIEIDEQIKQGTEETAKLKQLQQLLKSLG